MKQVYVAKHPTDAHLLKDVLDSEGIAAEVRGESLFAVRGEVPVTPDTSATVWILDDSLYDRAMEVVADYESGVMPEGEEGAVWLCPKCGESVEGQFGECWSCGTSRPEAGK